MNAKLGIDGTLWIDVPLSTLQDADGEPIMFRLELVNDKAPLALESDVAGILATLHEDLACRLPLHLRGSIKSLRDNAANAQAGADALDAHIHAARQAASFAFEDEDFEDAADADAETDADAEAHADPEPPQEPPERKDEQEPNFAPFAPPPLRGTAEQLPKGTTESRVPQTRKPQRKKRKT